MILLTSYFNKFKKKSVVYRSKKLEEHIVNFLKHAYRQARRLAE
jgi:hypothetical protein